MPLPLLPQAELNLTKLDRWSLLSRLQTLAYQVVPQWSDFSPAFAENLLLEAQALIGSMMASVVNERCRQMTRATVTDRLAMIRMSLPFGYSLAGATAAQADGTFYIPNGALATKLITIPAGTRIQSGEAIFETIAEMTIAVGNNASASGTVENSETQTEQFQSSETANIILQLSMDSIIDGSVSVEAGNGAYYDDDSFDGTGAKLRSFLEAGPEDRAFIVLIDNAGRAYIYFGNSINGVIPQGAITATYKTGGGEAGRVSGGASWTVLDSIYDADGNAVTVMFQNPSASVGGFNATTVEEARVRSPLAMRTIERCVNEEDFEYVATLTAGVARAAMITSNYDTAIPEDVGRMYVVAFGSPYGDSGYYPPAAPTAAQLAVITANIAPTGSYPQLMGVSIAVYAAVFRDITVKAKIYKESSYTAAQVKANLTESLQKFFAVADDNRAPNLLIDFGYKLLDADGNPDYKIAWSKVLNVINDTAGVREVSYANDNLLLNESRQSVVLQPHEFPRLSSITVYDMDNSGVEI